MKRIAIFRRLTTVPRLLFPAALVLVLLAAPESLIAQASFAPQPPPNVVLQPNQGRPGDVVSVRAVNMPRDRSAKIFFQPPGLRISNIQWGDYVTFRVAVAKNARPGAYTLVISPMQRAPVRVPGAFIVLPAPRERAAPPRVLRVSPQQLDPGKTYTLTLYGEAFQQGMKVDFGADLQNLTPPIVLEPRRAQMTVLVSPTATAGVRLAKATNLQGAGNKGPGGIIVKTAAVMRPAKPVKAEVKLKIPEIKPPEGRIVLMAPKRNAASREAALLPVGPGGRFRHETGPASGQAGRGSLKGSAGQAEAERRPEGFHCGDTEAPDHPGRAEEHVRFRVPGQDGRAFFHDRNDIYEEGASDMGGEGVLDPSRNA
ncbi:MAG: hypothetical protein P8Z49_12470 [Acidobacteriota bacterium]